VRSGKERAKSNSIPKKEDVPCNRRGQAISKNPLKTGNFKKPPEGGPTPPTGQSVKGREITLG